MVDGVGYTLITVAIIDDHALVRESLAAICVEHSGAEIVYAGDDVSHLADIHPRPDVVLLDLDLGTARVTDAEAQAIIERGSQVIVVSALGSPDTVRSMLDAGVSAFVSKRDTTSSLRAALDAVTRGEFWTSADLAAALLRAPERPKLSEREEAALVLYASGLKMASVARRLGVRPSTAKEYIERVREKYAAVGRPAPTKVHLHSVAQEDGFFRPET